eukprot:CAMPEP_0181041944 /NCGR_PEP_ID=MMETSP1070-20121207/11878_1 /TAXON_ID=265543 /ORGANISM="Minutocellus polymorphus, Strain NH13" /LENGTH=291 /DNA_ID=CAMNT_0023120107 /DNA_START=27 /DNA_END=902 /DNA_ORIENTATION=+
MTSRATLLSTTLLGCALFTWQCVPSAAFTSLPTNSRTTQRRAATCTAPTANAAPATTAALFATTTDAPSGRPTKEEGQQPEPLSPAKIGEMIEVTFVNGVMQLSQGFIDVLKLFIVATKAGYEQGMSLPTLLEEVEACPVRSANRPLMDEEAALRSSWMNVVYLVLERVGHGTDDATVGSTIDEGARTKYGAMVNTLADAQRRQEEEGSKTDTIAPLTLDEIVEMGKSSGTSFDGLNLEIDDAMEKAIAQQCLKVMKVVFTVLDEERLCYDEGGVGPAPRPPIPGAFKGTN